MKKLTITAILLFSLPTWAGDSIGQIVDVAGDAWLQHAGEAKVVAHFKDPLFLKDVIETKKGAVKILFQDDTLLTLKENTKTMITEFIFDATKNKRKGTFDVSFGKVRTIVGRFFGENESVSIKTPTAVAGIRGTDVGAVVGPKRTDFYCFDGRVNTFNVLSPDRIVPLTRGYGIYILEGEEASSAARIPIPETINEQSFDISLYKSTEEGEKKTAQDQKETATKEEAKEETKESPSKISSTKSDYSYSRDSESSKMESATSKLASGAVHEMVSKELKSFDSGSQSGETQSMFSNSSTMSFEKGNDTETLTSSSLDSGLNTGGASEETASAGSSSTSNLTAVTITFP